MARVATGLDPLTAEERSARMSKVKARGNRSTERAVFGVLIEHGIDGWTQHCKDIVGRPDFFFERLPLALFVDGCFWHGCPVCDRNIPRNRVGFWRKKIEENRRRDRKVTRELRQAGVHVVRIWEHQIRDGSWVPPFRRILSRLGYNWRLALARGCGVSPQALSGNSPGTLAGEDPSDSVATS